MLRRLLMAAAAVLMLAPGVSSAAPVDFYHSPGDDGQTPGFQAPFALALGTNTLNIWSDPTTINGGFSFPGGGAFGYASATIALQGGGIDLVSFNCTAPCLQGATVTGTDGSTSFNAGDDIAGNDAPFRVGTLVVNVTALNGSTIDVTGGIFLDGSFGQGDIDPDPIAAAPEPTSLVLLGLGLGGIAFARRRA